MFNLSSPKPRRRRATDRRAGPRQGPYTSNSKLPRSRNKNGQWRRKNRNAGVLSGPRSRGLFGLW